MQPAYQKFSCKPPFKYEKGIIQNPTQGKNNSKHKRLFMTLAIKIIKLEEEYNSKFEDIVKSYAEGGHSKYDTAKLLGITYHAFNRLVKEIGGCDWFPKYSVAMRHAAESKRGRAPVEAQKANFERHAFEYGGVTDTMSGHARRLGISYHKVRYRRFKNKPLEGGYW